MAVHRTKLNDQSKQFYRSCIWSNFELLLRRYVNVYGFYRTTAHNATRGIATVVLLSQFCLSVRLSATRVLVRKPKNALQMFWCRAKGQSLYYSDNNSVWWSTPSSVWNLHSKWPTPFEKRRLQQISACNVSTVRDGEKVRLWRLGTPPRAFQRAIDGVRTLPLCPLKGVSKSDFFVFWNKSQLQSNKVYYTKFVCVKSSSGILQHNYSPI